MSGACRVAVLGGGIIGTTSAYALAQRGFDVLLIEAREGLGLETSFANGSLITPSMSDPWAAPGLPLKLLKWLGREDSPFLVRPTALPGMLTWGLRFLRNCESSRWQRNTETILKLAAYSQGALARVTAETGLSYDLASVGTLRLFRDKLSMDSATRVAEALGALGVRYAMLDRAGCIALEPALADQAETISGGIHFPDDQHGDAYAFTHGLGEVCAGLGVELRFNERIESLEHRGRRVTAVVTDKTRHPVDHVVLALGSESVDWARRLGLRLPVYPVKGYSVTLQTAGWNRGFRHPLIDDARKIGMVPLGDRIRLAGTAEFTGRDLSPNPARSDNLLEGFRALFPGFPNFDSAESWTGLRPMTPDGIPILGPTAIENLSLNVGQGHLGWTMACGSAEVIADQIAGRPPEIDAEDMTLARF